MSRGIKMINYIKKVIASYVETEKILTQIQCLIVDNGQEIRKVIKSFPRKHRNFAMKKAFNLAYWGYSINEIIDKLILTRAILK